MTNTLGKMRSRRQVLDIESWLNMTGVLWQTRPCPLSQGSLALSFYPSLPPSSPTLPLSVSVSVCLPTVTVRPLLVCVCICVCLTPAGFERQGYRENDAVFLKSDTDEQLLINIPFSQVVKLHSIHIKGPSDGTGKYLTLPGGKLLSALLHHMPIKDDIPHAQDGVLCDWGCMFFMAACSPAVLCADATFPPATGSAGLQMCGMLSVLRPRCNQAPSEYAFSSIGHRSDSARLPMRLLPRTLISQRKILAPTRFAATNVLPPTPAVLHSCAILCMHSRSHDSEQHPPPPPPPGGPTHTHTDPTFRSHCR